jgi:hypothetical protein
MKRLISTSLWVLSGVCLFFVFPAVSDATLIDFDDVAGSVVDITNRYADLGVTLNAIDNPFPLTGPYPAPATLPTIQGRVTTWTQGFDAATSAPQVAVAAPTPETGDPGDGGILISFAFDVISVSLVGNDMGFTGGADDESVTLTAYNAAGDQIGQVYSITNLPGSYDRTPATISLQGMRYVAFNYTDSIHGFYAIDDLEFVIPEPATVALFGLGGLALLRKRL